MPFGAECLEAGGVRFRLWAPSCRAVELVCDAGAAGSVPHRSMQAQPDGWHERVVADAGPGTRYGFRVGGGLCVADPASRFNPEDVHGRSEVMDPLSYPWRCEDWRGRPWEGAVVYELHVGTFTPEGTFAAAAARLGELQALGITVVELMPVADFPGTRNWGYDGVLPFAPDASYGRPDDLKRLVDAAHALGLMMVLDVVYNHFGPDGNYLSVYCPEFFDTTKATPWGPALNLAGAHGDLVRSFFVHNALYWIEEYRFDGLRLDAIHAMADGPDKRLTREICAALQAGPGRERAIHVILENDGNLAGLLARDAQQRPRVATAQWNDDLHHAAHVLATGERDGYYADYAADPVGDLAKALAEGFIYQGQRSGWRGGAARGEPSRGLPPPAFIAFLQNHD
ncbi:MAG TPA: alpha-amylase family glycosyl hydrolase, partial [Burkholderiaceae bacterium]